MAPRSKEKEITSVFKLKELGIYQSEKGKYYHIVHELSGKVFIATNQENTTHYRFDEDGEVLHHPAWGAKLVKYIGKEFPSGPREFQFTAELGESPGRPVSSLIVSRLIGHFTSCLRTPDDHSLNEFGKTSKWEVTMKEIL